MGGKHIRGRKRFLFLVAGLILLVFSGCTTMAQLWEEISRQNSSPEGKTLPPVATVATVPPKKEDLAKATLKNGKKLIVEGDYQGALQEFQKVVTLLDKASPADEAVFHAGLVHLYWGNPKKDYDQALTFMKRVGKEYPQSPFLLQANTWIGILLAYEKIVGENGQLIKDLAKQEKENEKLGRENEKYSRENEKLIKDHEKLVKENEKLIKMLEEYKQVDIETEGRKREKGR
jgi:hypothetical protein